MATTTRFIAIFSLIVVTWSARSFTAQAQMAGDTCFHPIVLTNTNNWCSASGAYTNVGYTPSGFSAPTCGGDYSHDIWFSFVATALDVTINISGNTGGGGNGGTMIEPCLTLYQGDCTSMLNELRCAKSASGSNSVDLYKGGLIPGNNYLIRVGGVTAGSFKLCINNYNQPAIPTSDCITASLLCDKSPFSVQSVSGVGNVADEAAGTCLDTGIGASESNSVWFKWVCDQSGSLTFTLTPNVISDDLDFVVYELPSGINGCGSKVKVRCEASGENFYPSPCMGPTGLNDTSTDTDESPGCAGAGHDAFVAALQMQAGHAYALMVNNYTLAGNGFSVTWGGTGTFRGPIANYLTSPAHICSGDTLTITDASSDVLGTLISKTWSFNSDGIPSAGIGGGPFKVAYALPGPKTLVQTVQSSIGCIITKVTTINVDTCCQTRHKLQLSAPQIIDARCFGATDGKARISANGYGLYAPIHYAWSNGALVDSITHVSSGVYTVRVADRYCRDSVQAIINEPPPFSLAYQVQPPTCNGGHDGVVTLGISGATAPYAVQWSFNGSTTPTITKVPVGTYFATITDAHSCTAIKQVDVHELELQLSGSAASNLRCFGDSDGFIGIHLSNGLPPYQFDFHDGIGFQNSNLKLNLIAGTYPVEVRDANNCVSHFDVTITSPMPVVLHADSTAVSCFGSHDGAAQIYAAGGTMPYHYVWNDPAQHHTDSLSLLYPGVYVVTVSDFYGCTRTRTVHIDEPNEIFINRIDTLNNLCYGYSEGALRISANGGTAPYTYSLDDIVFQPDTAFTALPSREYHVFVKDSRGCVAERPARLLQPSPLVINAKPDKYIELGADTLLDTKVLPTGRPLVFLWQPPTGLSCTDCFQPRAAPTKTTTYVVTARDETGCITTDTVTVFVSDRRPVYIPNVFTPNNDGINDTFHPYGSKAVRQVARMQVFDRWGELLYEQSNFPPNDDRYGWDGNLKGARMNPAVFVYRITFDFYDDTSKTYTGDVMLVR